MAQTHIFTANVCLAEDRFESYNISIQYPLKLQGFMAPSYTANHFTEHQKKSQKEDIEKDTEFRMSVQLF